jgi:alcohol dehydrogenase class IV
MPFSSFNTVSRVVNEAGCLEALPEEIGRFVRGAGRILIVSDAGIAAAGILDRVESVLSGSGLKTRVFSDFRSDPPMEDARASAAFALDYRPDLVVGIGGGSSLDIAKLTAVMMTNPGPIDRYVGMERIYHPGPPLILIPTTAGGGSEVTSLCVLSDTENREKKGIVSRHLFARSVLLDPDLTLGLPPRITATTGMDALLHAIESYTGRRATPLTDALNIASIRLIGANLRKAYEDGGDRQARKNMLYASCMAGMAFSNTQNALGHALALAIGGRYDLPHGLVSAIICPWVMEFNLKVDPWKYADIASALGENLNDAIPEEAAGISIRAVRSLLDYFGISSRLSDHGVEAEQLPAIAEAAMGKARLITNNPREVTETDIVRLLESNY